MIFLTGTDMMDPGVHEDAALHFAERGDADAAQVRAILALAAAVNRLAKAQETIAWAAPPA